MHERPFLYRSEYGFFIPSIQWGGAEYQVTPVVGCPALVDWVEDFSEREINDLRNLVAEDKEDGNRSQVDICFEGQQGLHNSWTDRITVMTMANKNQYFVGLQQAQIRLMLWEGLDIMLSPKGYFLKDKMFSSHSAK